MREAVIVSTARTPIGRAFRGAFNATPSPTLAGHAIAHAVKRAGIDATYGPHFERWLASGAKVVWAERVVA